MGLVELVTDGVGEFEVVELGVGLVLPLMKDS